MEGGVAEREDAAVGRDEPVALAARRRGHADDRLPQPDCAGRAVEAGVAEREDAAVARNEPIALARRCVRHADDGTVQPLGARGAEEARVAEAEDAAVGRDQPVALVGRRARDVGDRLLQLQRAGRAVELRVAETEDAAVLGDDPVAEPGAGRFHAGHRCVEYRRRLALVRGVSERVHRRVVPCRHGASCSAVDGEVALVCEQVASYSHGGRARDHPAHDRADAAHFLMALAVTELVATREPLIARAARAMTSAVVARRRAHALGAATTRAARRVAVDVVTRSAAAEARVVDLPPAAGYRARRARVLAAVHGAAHRAPPRTTVGGRPAPERGVRGAGLHQVAERIDGERGAHNRGLHEKAASAPSCGRASPTRVLDRHAPTASRCRSRSDRLDAELRVNALFTVVTIAGSDARLPATTYRQNARPPSWKNSCVPSWPAMRRCKRFGENSAGVTCGTPFAGEQGLLRGFRPVLEQRDERVVRLHHRSDIAAEVVALFRQRKARHVHDWEGRFGDAGWESLRDSRFPSGGERDSEAVRTQLGHERGFG